MQNFSFLIDVRWCLDALLADSIIDQKSYHVVNTGRIDHSAHPLTQIAKFGLTHQGTQKILSLDTLNQWLADKAGMMRVHIDPLKLDANAITSLLSFEFAKSQHILPLENADEVVIATDQPFYTDWHSNIEALIKGRPWRVVYVDCDKILRLRQELYQVAHAMRQSDTRSNIDSSAEALFLLGDIQNPDANDQHIVKIVDWLLQYAFEQRASDIHLEPRRETGKMRFRIDGVLHDVYQMPAHIMTAVVARIKILARLNIAEKRKPQDGRLKTRTQSGNETELRIATMPTAFGEKLVMRIFDPEVLLRPFDALGLDGNDFALWQKLISHPNGIILVTGPTGSGKTTTLYSTLKKLATSDVNVCTVEDPIEMIESNFNQMQVNHAIELGFADGIRALMRQDPDIIMVGEIRDPDTANMAVQAALTGHLVLSTLHTNDAPSALLRLHDLGVQPFLSVATVLGVMAQRLVRALCTCKEARPINDDERMAWQSMVKPFNVNPPPHLYHPKGCEACRHTGYKGRVGLYEIMPLSGALKTLINDNASLDSIKIQAYREGVLPLRVAGARRVAQGLTTLEEVIRTTPQL